MIDENLLSPCGLYCGVCGIRSAYLSGKPSFIAAMAKTYGVEPEQIKCEGCRSDAPFCVFRRNRTLNPEYALEPDRFGQRLGPRFG